LPNSARNIFDTFANMDEDKKLMRNARGEAAVKITQDDIDKRKHPIGMIMQAKPMEESIRRDKMYYDGDAKFRSNRSKAEAMAEIKRLYSQGIRDKKIIEEHIREYIENGGNPDSIAESIKTYMEEKDIPYALRGIQRGQANLQKKKILGIVNK